MDGRLQCTSDSFPPGAIVVNFLHLGSGNVVNLPSNDGSTFAQPHHRNFNGLDRTIVDSLHAIVLGNFLSQ